MSNKILADLFDDVAVPVGKLPLVHTTDLYRFQPIRESKSLSPRKQPDYDQEHLLFCFYGRPCYRVHNVDEQITGNAFAPVCLVLSNRLLSESHRIMPFDSGAMKAGMLSPPVHKDMTEGQFELRLHPYSVRKLIDRFYGTEENYYHDKIGSRPEFSEWDNLPADSYDKLVRKVNNQGVDDRSSAIEIQFNKVIQLPGTVLAAVIPKGYAKEPGIVEEIQSWGSGHPAAVLTYNLPDSWNPKELNGALKEKVTDFLYSNKTLKGDL